MLRADNTIRTLAEETSVTKIMKTKETTRKKISITKARASINTTKITPLCRLILILMLTLIKGIPELITTKSGSMISFKIKGTGKIEIKVSSMIRLNRTGINSSLNTNSSLTELIMESEKIDKMTPSSVRQTMRSTNEMSSINWEIFKINTCNRLHQVTLMHCSLMRALDERTNQSIYNR